MSAQRTLGNSALDRLGSYLDDVERTCTACGYRDTEGRWRAETTGDRVVYRHECPSCGLTITRTLDFERR